MYEHIVLDNGQKMMRWVLPEEQAERLIRAWAENPFFGKLWNEPVYLLVEILEANQSGQWARVREVGAVYEYNMPYKILHCVHEFDNKTNRLLKIHGEPKGTV